MPCSKFIDHKCSKCNNNKIFVVSENKCKYQLINEYEKLICQINIDGCCEIAGKKCDYLFLNCEDLDAYFVELKGVSIIDAIKQILNSIAYLLPHLKNFKINARIILTRYSYPNLENNPDVITLLKKLKQLNGNLIKKTINLSEII